MVEGLHEPPLGNLPLHQELLGSLGHRLHGQRLVIHPREKQDGHGRISLPDPTEGVEPPAVGKREVEDDGMEPLGSQHLQPLGKGSSHRGLEGNRLGILQHGANEEGVGLVVLDDQDPEDALGLGHIDGGAAQGFDSRGAAAGLASGKVKCSEAPDPGSDSAQIRPPSCSTILRHRANPRPEPGRWRDRSPRS